MRSPIVLAAILVLVSGCFESGAPAEPNEATPQDPVPEPTPTADVDIMEGIDLTLGLPETTWTFTVERGASAFARVGLIGRFVDQVVADGAYCLKWERRAPHGISTGSQGSCGFGNIQVSISGPDLGHQTLLDWPEVAVGTYLLSIRADPQPNILNVVVQVDNPPLQGT